MTRLNWNWTEDDLRLVREDRQAALDIQRGQFNEVAYKIIDLIGEEDYLNWVDTLPDDADWVQLRKFAVDFLTLLENPQECTCVLPEQTCPVCAKISPESDEFEELPY